MEYKSVYLGIDGMDGARLLQSLKEAGDGATFDVSPLVPKYQAHIFEKYLRSSQYNSSGQYFLPGRKIPYPVNFETGKPIKSPLTPPATQ